MAWGAKALIGAFAGIHVFTLFDFIPEAQALAHGLDQDLAAMGTGLFGVGELEPVGAMMFGKRTHGNTSPYR